MKIVESSIDPVYLKQLFEKVALPIGDGHGSRHAHLTPLDAKMLAYALLAEAERVGASPIPQPS